MAIEKIQTSTPTLVKEALKKPEEKKTEIKVKVKEPLVKDTFEKQKGKGIDEQGRITNDNGLINN